MNEAIVLLMLGIIVIMLLIAFLYTQSTSTSISIQLYKKINLENERAKEDLKAVWTGDYHVILVNDGGRDLLLSWIYVYVNGSRVPLYSKDMGNILLEAGDSMNLSLLEFGAKPDLDRYGYARLPSNDPTIYFSDQYFLSGDVLDFGSLNYSLRRDPGAGDLEVELGSGSSELTLCAWIKVESNAAEDQVIIDADGLKIYYNAGDNSIEVSVKKATLEPTEEIDPGEWNHFCVVVKEKKAWLYVNGLLNSYKEVKGTLNIRRLTLKRPDVRYWVDDLLFVPTGLEDSQVRGIAAGAPQAPNYVRFTFDRLVNEISRIDVVTDLGISYNFTRITDYLSSHSISGSCSIISPPPALLVDCGKVLPTAYVPLRIPGDYSGLYLIRYNKWVRYWNVTGYSTGVKLIYDSTENMTSVDMSNGRGLQLVTILDLIRNWRDVEAMLGDNLTFQLVRVDDGSLLQVNVTIETLSLTDLAWSDDIISGKVIWADGEGYNPRGDWEYVRVLVLETGDEGVVNSDGTFQFNLSTSESEVSMVLLFPERALPMFGDYKVPFSGVYVLERGG